MGTNMALDTAVTKPSQLHGNVKTTFTDGTMRNTKKKKKKYCQATEILYVLSIWYLALYWQHPPLVLIEISLRDSPAPCWGTLSFGCFNLMHFCGRIAFFPSPALFPLHPPSQDTAIYLFL